MIYNELFLKKLQEKQIQKKYAKIILLDWNEYPIKELQGEITNGSINIDGNSAVRTTINLTMVSRILDFTKYNIALQSKIRIDIGLQNEIDIKYPDIIWLQLGIFIVTGFNTSCTLQQSTLSISGKDKMCLLNGEISGQIPATTDFGQIDTYENTYSPISTSDYLPGKYYYKETIEDNDVFFIDYNNEPQQSQYYDRVSTVTTTKLNIKDIIYSMVYIWGHEIKSNIIINDLDLMGNELLEYRGSTPLYLIKEYNTDSNIFLNLILDPNYEINGRAISSLQEDEYYSLNPINNNTQNLFVFSLNDKEYVIVKINYGETLGYKPTDLVFAGDLIAAPGESVVTILDKIKNMLGNYEYFYDVNGKFIFQAKHTYELVDYTKFLVDGNGEVYLNGSPYNNKTIYTFSDENQFTNISHTPNLQNLRNDYSIWGESTSSNGVKKQIHLRYGIEKKPESYLTIGDGPRSGILYKTSGTQEEVEISNNYLSEIFNEFKALLEKQQEYIKNAKDFQNRCEDEINFYKNAILMSISDFLNNYIIKLKDNYFLNPINSEINFIENDFYVNDITKSSWINTFAEKYTNMTKDIIKQFKTILMLMFQDLIDGNITDVQIQEALNNFKYWDGYKNSIQDYDDNEYAKYMMGNFLLKISLESSIIQQEWNTFRENYAARYSNYDIGYYYGYLNSIFYFNNLLKQIKEDINNILNNKVYDNIFVFLMNMWQVQIYLLYLETTAKIDRQLIYYKENENMIFTDEDYTYIKYGIQYNHGDINALNDFINFKTTDAGKIFYGVWCFLNDTDREDLSYNLYMLYFLIKQYLIDEKNNQQELANILHQLEKDYYISFNNKKEEIRTNKIPLIVDWRELIYQMSRDFYDYGENPNYNYLSLLLESNKSILKQNFTLGYECFYTDIISNWRYLYFNPLFEAYEYNIKEATGNFINDYNENSFWILILQTDPSQITFWFDLTEGQEGLNQFCISKIGDRLKTVKETVVKNLFYKDTPNIIYYTEDNNQYITTENYNINSYSYFQLGGELDNLYTLSTQGQSAFDKLQELLYKFTYCAENITITSLPIYTLKPNYRIQINSSIPGFTNEYIINKITIPLIYNGTMSINATKSIPYLGTYENR